MATKNSEAVKNELIVKIKETCQITGSVRSLILWILSVTVEG